LKAAGRVIGPYLEPHNGAPPRRNVSFATAPDRAHGKLRPARFEHRTGRDLSQRTLHSPGLWQTFVDAENALALQRRIDDIEARLRKPVVSQFDCATAAGILALALRGRDIVRDLPRRDIGDHDGAGVHVGGTPLTFGASGLALAGLE
jgi:hypothetical protein